MSRRLRPLDAEGLAAFGTACATCVYWESPELLEVRCGAACSAELQREWLYGVHEEWGECGRVAFEDHEALGFIKYAPARFLPQARHLPAGSPNPAAPLIACLHVREESHRRGLGRLLLQAALRDLHGRGERSVYAFGHAAATNGAETPMPEAEFLLGQGFVVDRPDRLYPLLRLDLRTLAAWTENLEAALESLLLPLGRGNRLPTPSIE